MLTLLVALTCGAPAQDLVHARPVEPVRYHVEFAYHDYYYPEAWKAPPVSLHTHTVELECTTVADGKGWASSCAVLGGVVELGYRLEGEEGMVTRDIPFPVDLEARWSERGRLRSYDIQGDRAEYYQARGDFMREIVPFPAGITTSEWDKYGRVQELVMVGFLLGALEVELPRKGDDKGKPWSHSDTPMVLRADWRHSVGKLKYAVEERTPERFSLTMEGNGTCHPAAGSMSNHYVILDVSGRAVFEGGVLAHNEGTYAARYNDARFGPVLGPARVTWFSAWVRR